MSSTNSIFSTSSLFEETDRQVYESEGAQLESGEEANEHFWPSPEVARLLKGAVKSHQAGKIVENIR